MAYDIVAEIVKEISEDMGYVKEAIKISRERKEKARKMIKIIETRNGIDDNTYEPIKIVTFTVPMEIDNSTDIHKNPEDFGHAFKEAYIRYLEIK